MKSSKELSQKLYPKSIHNPLSAPSNTSQIHLSTYGISFMLIICYLAFLQPLDYKLFGVGALFNICVGSPNKPQYVDYFSYQIQTFSKLWRGIQGISQSFTNLLLYTPLCPYASQPLNRYNMCKSSSSTFTEHTRGFHIFWTFEQIFLFAWNVLFPSGKLLLICQHPEQCHLFYDFLI